MGDGAARQNASALDQGASKAMVDRLVWAASVARFAARAQGGGMMRDQPLPEDAAIRDAHPLRTGRHDLYAEAMRMVGAKHSKGALVELVNWLLWRLEDPFTIRGEDARRILEELQHAPPPEEIEKRRKCAREWLAYVTAPVGQKPKKSEGR